MMISNLKRIEAFVNLGTLIRYDNLLTTPDVSSKASLTMLDYSRNQLTSLDVSYNTAPSSRARYIFLWQPECIFSTDCSK